MSNFYICTICKWVNHASRMIPPSLKFGMALWHQNQSHDLILTQSLKHVNLFLMISVWALQSHNCRNTSGSKELIPSLIFCLADFKVNSYWSVLNPCLLLLKTWGKAPMVWFYANLHCTDLGRKSMWTRIAVLGQQNSKNFKTDVNGV